MTTSRPSKPTSPWPSSQAFPPSRAGNGHDYHERHVLVDAHADRTTTWTVEATNRVNAYLDWPHVGLVLRVETLTKRQGLATREVWHGVTSVTAERADAAQLSRWWRGHWGIENRVHYVRDVTLGEDANRTRVGSGPQALAACRNVALNVLRSEGVTNIARAIRTNAWATRPLLVKLRILKN